MLVNEALGSALFVSRWESSLWDGTSLAGCSLHHGIAALSDGKEPVTSWYVLFYVIAWGHHGIAAWLISYSV